MEVAGTWQQREDIYEKVKSNSFLKTKKKRRKLKRKNHKLKTDKS